MVSPLVQSVLVVSDFLHSIVIDGVMMRVIIWSEPNHTFFRGGGGARLLIKTLAISSARGLVGAKFAGVNVLKLRI